MSSDHFRFWAREQFAKYRGAVGYIETVGADGNPQIGTCFHVGEGVFVTARHIVDKRNITKVGFDDDVVNQDLLKERRHWGQKSHGRVNIILGPYFHPQANCDVACFKVEPHPKVWIPLGGHFDDYLGQYELVLYRTLILGYPRIPLAAKPALVASVGEVNALLDLYLGSRHPHFIISTMARGGFSGAPALVAYNEENTDGGTAVLGVVTQALTSNDQEPEQGYLAVLTVEPIFTCLEKNKMLPKNQRYESRT
jgi:hypothetical protein